jgi:hypothetical protein
MLLMCEKCMYCVHCSGHLNPNPMSPAITQLCSMSTYPYHMPWQPSIPPYQHAKYPIAVSCAAEVASLGALYIPPPKKLTPPPTDPHTTLTRLCRWLPRRSGRPWCNTPGYAPAPPLLHTQTRTDKTIQGTTHTTHIAIQLSAKRT